MSDLTSLLTSNLKDLVVLCETFNITEELASLLISTFALYFFGTSILVARLGFSGSSLLNLSKRKPSLVLASRLEINFKSCQIYVGFNIVRICCDNYPRSRMSCVLVR